ncbi:hypothetical protein TNCV_1561281 [Trichonephila clavipes]|nr:hypothetical protein TNCV_1561281 [Trichonephila clavipes]
MESFYRQDNTLSYTAVGTQCALHSVVLLPWPVRYQWTITPTLSPASIHYPSIDTTSTTSMELYTIK